MDANTVAVTIRNQIMAGSVRGCKNGAHAMMCWGFKNPLRDTDDEQRHSLIFQVSGLTFKGKVKVRLDHNDTYSIHFYKYPWETWKEQESDVYCEELAQILDNLIEK